MAPSFGPGATAVLHPHVPWALAYGLYTPTKHVELCPESTEAEELA